MSGEYQAFEQALELAARQGNVEAARSITEDMRRAMQRTNPNLGMPDPVKLGQENMPQSIRQTASDEFGAGAQRMAGIGSAPMIAGHAIAQMGGADNQADLQNWQSVRSATPNTQVGNMAGNALQFGALPARAIGPALAGAERVAPWLKPATEAAKSRYGTVFDVGATQGGAAAATTPDSDSRLMAGMLGVTGASVPGVMAAGQSVRRTATTEGKKLALAEALRREVTGPDAERLLSDLETKRYPTQGYGVQPSAAMLTRNPTLETMETGSRTRTPDLWSNFDRTNAAMRWQELERQAGTPQEVARLKGARDALTTPMRNEALQGTGGATQVGAGTPYQKLSDTLAELSGGANRPNRDVQTLVAYVSGELEKGVTPEQLYTMRKMLTDGIKAGPTSELSQAARAARPQRMEIIGAIDQTLNEMSGGKWNQYLETYKLASPLIGSKTAMQNITADLRYGRPVGEVPISMGEQPSPYALGRLLEQYGSKDFGSKSIDQLIPQHRSLVEALVQDLNAQSAGMRSRATIGSPTATNLANAGRVNQITSGALDAAGNAIPLVGGAVAASAKGSLNRKAEEALAQLLKDPQALAEALRRAQASQQMLEQSGQVGAAAGGAYRGSR